MNIWEFFAEYDRLAAKMDDEALEKWLTEAYAAYKTENPDDVKGHSGIANELGSFYRARGEYDKAKVPFTEAKIILESSGNADGLDYATTLNNLAGNFRLAGELEKALELFGKAREIYARTENVPAELYASCFNNEGLVYQDLSRFDEALEMFTEALERIQDLPDNQYMAATTLSNIAFAELGRGNKPQAAQVMKVASQLFQAELGDESPMYKRSAEIAEEMAK